MPNHRERTERFLQLTLTLAVPCALALCWHKAHAQTPPAGSLTPIHQIQGPGSTSPLVGQTVTTEGVVTRLNNNGFYLQALVGDGDEATSDGMFVFTSTAPSVSPGQWLRLSGRVTEFNTGAASNALTLAHTVTQLTSPTGVTVLGSGYSIAPTPISLPLTGGLERVEGMLVTLAGPLTINQNYFQARYGQLTLSAGGRLETPTNRHRPGTPEAVSMAQQNAARRIVLDDGSTAQNVNPTPYTGPQGIARAGDLLGAITGVIDYGLATASNTGLADYRIIPTVPVTHVSGNPRPTLAPAVGGNVKVGSMNVLNYFTTFTNGQTADGKTGQGCTLGTSTSASNCRGANNLTEFQRQQAKIVAALSTLDADAVGLMEIQNNGNTAVQTLVNALNAQVGAGTYASIALPAQGTGTDAIRLAIIYKPARLSPKGAPLSDTHAINNRPTLGQAFTTPNGMGFSLVVNHLKSKGCSGASGLDADQGDGQGCFNDTRVQQAQQLRNFVAQLQQQSGSPDVLLVGDFNAYAQEDPIHTLTSNGLVDLVGRFNSFGYSYVFDGAAGRLDHALATATLASKVSGTREWHINADEGLAHDYNLEFKQPACATCAPDPYQPHMYKSSDHDPVLVGLNLYPSVLTASGTIFSGTAQDDLITVGAGRRTLQGGAGADQFVFTSAYSGGATIADFRPGTDLLNLTAVLRAMGVQSDTPWATGHLQCRASGASDALVLADPDAQGPAAARALILLQGVPCAQLDNRSFVR
ncbi:ExeM/NucH family extracellular endonuclease [Aquabacterium lacunae]|uniref:ExeM/NucH family extracellular endonuclease n=1 Tax=Aquabacterium lacunae TaxID=2528630 RepID=A0A4Q9GVJ6_9BURK|nr:ExeM/NucH family extracellular endonuclease [Aquabacterium lacunae]TBO27862.1 ExeM/NucH family extracellular endonuclease [Aquabacterium lacunae]